MPSKYFTFVRIRVFVLAYAAAISVLSFAIVLFVLPTVGATRVPTLAVIAGVSLVAGFVESIALVMPKTRCCRRKSRGRRGRKMHVGLEILCNAALLPLFATAIFLEAELAIVHASNTDSYPNPETGSAQDPDEGRTLSALLLVFTCSTALLITMYTGLISGLAVYTHSCTSQVDVWFEDAAARTPAFVFPRPLRFLHALDDDRESEADMERARERRRGQQLEQFEASPTHLALVRHMHMRERTAHTPAPDCDCGEKLARGPSHPDEYRALSRGYARVRSLVAEREAEAQGRTLDRTIGHRRAVSAPLAVSMLRMPTERERRRTVYLVGFEGARFGVD